MPILIGVSPCAKLRIGGELNVDAASASPACTTRRRLNLLVGICDHLPLVAAAAFAALCEPRPKRNRRLASCTCIEPAELFRPRARFATFAGQMPPARLRQAVARLKSKMLLGGSGGCAAIERRAASDERLDFLLREPGLAQNFDAVLTEPRLQPVRGYRRAAEAHRQVGVENLALGGMRGAFEKAGGGELRIGQHLVQ